MPPGRPKGSKNKPFGVGWAGPEQNRKAKEALTAAILPALALPQPPAPISAITAVNRYHQKIIDSENLTNQVVWLRFCGLREIDIAQRTGISQPTISKYINSDEYRSAYVRLRDSMLARVEEAMRERLQEVVIEAIEVKIDLMRTHRNGFLRNRAASELIALGREALQFGRGNVSDLLTAIHEQAVKEKGDGTRTTTQRVTIEGSPENVAAALRSRNGAGGSGPPPPTDGGPGPESRAERLAEAPIDAGGARSDGDDGGSGLQSGS